VCTYSKQCVYLFQILKYKRKKYHLLQLIPNVANLSTNKSYELDQLNCIPYISVIKRKVNMSTKVEITANDNNHHIAVLSVSCVTVFCKRS